MPSIGDLAKKLGLTPETSASLLEKSRQRLVSSGTTSPAKTPPSRSNVIGLRPGSGGSVATRQSASAVDPAGLLRAVQALLPQEIQSSLRPVYSGQTLTGYALSKAVGPNAIAQAERVLSRSLTPMDGAKCLEMLTELKRLTRPSPGSTTDLEEQMVAYLKRLLEYPADVVDYVLRTQATSSPWWPAWAELQERLEILTYRRRHMLKAVTNTTT